MEDAERVRVVCSAIPTALDCTGDLVAGDSKRHNRQTVELSQRTQAAVQIVSNLPAPIDGGPIYSCWECRPCTPAGWLALLLTKAGDVETNPGPTTFKQASLDL